MKRRSTIRLRLTLLYAGAFFLAGAVLVALTYFSLDQALERRSVGAGGAVRRFIGERGMPGGRTEGLFAAVAEQAERDRRETLHAMLVWSLVSLGAVGAVAGMFGWLLAGRALLPLQQITATARRVADRSLHERIDLDGPEDEIKDLADTFDAMLERLDRAFDSQRRFVANASHELRTPLTINRTLVEVALEDPEVAESTRRLGATLLKVNERNEQLIDGLLVLASSEQALETHARVDLAEVAHRALAVADAAARQSGVRVQSDIESVVVNGDPILPERMVQNVIDNAIRYNTAESGWVTVTVGSDRGLATLTVENSGPTVASFEVAGLFEPFRRLAASSGKATGRGAGLGLSIVRSVATAHGGQVNAVARPEGGLTVTVGVPSVQ